jgi:hypothetical protein
MDFHACERRRASLCYQRSGPEADGFRPGSWAVTWGSRRCVLAQVSVKNRREPWAPGLDQPRVKTHGICRQQPEIRTTQQGSSAGQTAQCRPDDTSKCQHLAAKWQTAITLTSRPQPYACPTLTEAPPCFWLQSHPLRPSDARASEAPRYDPA